MTIIPYSREYRDDMIFMILEAKDALGRIPRINDDLLDIEGRYLDRGDGFWLALEERGGVMRVIGSVGYNRIPGTDEAYLHRLYVKPGLHRQGIGSALLRTAEEAMRERGIRLCRVHLGAPRSLYYESYAFYPKHGYRESGTRYMEKELAPWSGE